MDTTSHALNLRHKCYHSKSRDGRRVGGRGVVRSRSEIECCERGEGSGKELAGGGDLGLRRESMSHSFESCSPFCPQDPTHALDAFSPIRQSCQGTRAVSNVSFPLHVEQTRLLKRCREWAGGASGGVHTEWAPPSPQHSTGTGSHRATFECDRSPGKLASRKPWECTPTISPPAGQIR